jgi:N-acetyl sugar amidotransferase
MSENHQVCTRCVMDTTDPEITFDEAGVCSHCRSFDAFSAKLPGLEQRKEQLARIVEEIKDWGKNKEYDCILGLSGGVDSSFVALKAKELGLRPLVVHFDSGWNSEIAVKNIENIVRKLGFDLYTYVIDWEEMKDLQLAYLKASVVNADIPQDYAFFTVLYKIASDHGIKYFLSGYNYQTEFILPEKWVYPTRDFKNIRSIHKAFGKLPLRKYPAIGLVKDIYYVYFKIKRIDLLSFIDYNKKDAMKVLEDELGWRYYGGKHYESIWTRFFQGYYLPAKFSIDKRKAHLSSLVITGQMTREEAVEEMKKDPYPSGMLESDIQFVMKKLGINRDEFNAIMSTPPRDHREFGNNWRIMSFARYCKAWITRLTGKLG